jgi:hypothetical protein
MPRLIFDVADVLHTFRRTRKMLQLGFKAKKEEIWEQRWAWELAVVVGGKVGIGGYKIPMVDAGAAP